MDKDLICILRACPLINIGRRTLVGIGNSQMVHLRNGTPEHRTAYHLLLSDPISFDQNNCHLHCYHQFCHLHWHHSPSHHAFYGFKGGIFWIRSNAYISSEKITHGLPSKPSPYLLLQCNWDFLHLFRYSDMTKHLIGARIGRLMQACRSQVSRNGGLLCFSIWWVSVRSTGKWEK